MRGLAILPLLLALAECSPTLDASDFVANVDDNAVTAIEIARKFPAVADYIALPQIGEPTWSVPRRV